MPDGTPGSISRRVFSTPALACAVRHPPGSHTWSLLRVFVGALGIFSDPRRERKEAAAPPKPQAAYRQGRVSLALPRRHATPRPLPVPRKCTVGAEAPAYSCRQQFRDGGRRRNGGRPPGER